MLKRIVDGVEVLALVGAAVFVILLFAPGDDGGGSGGGEGEAAATEGSEVYAANCAGCHGPDGGGNVGPQLSGGAVVEAFPDAADEIAVVTEGRGGMPPFGDSLTPEQIEAVVDYTRTTLAES